jgi:hypothetical protein
VADEDVPPPAAQNSAIERAGARERVHPSHSHEAHRQHGKSKDKDTKSPKKNGDETTF